MTENKDHGSPATITRLIAQLLDRGATATLITIVRGPHTGAKLLLDERGITYGSLGDPDLDRRAAAQTAEFLKSHHQTRMLSGKELAPEFPAATETLLLFERIEPAPRLIICGAGHVGAALAKLGSFLGFQTTLIDDRAEFLERSRFSEEQLELVVAENWEQAVSGAIGNGHGVSVAVVTRGHNEDERCMHAVMRANADYIGLIGSKRRTTIVIERLREKGATDAQLRKVHAPIGLDIGAVSPEEVALAILAEIVAERRGAAGGSLSAWRRSEL